jgi:hypothetical protein
MTNETKQTAVEWLVEQLRNNENIRWRGTPFFELAEQAKEIEKVRMESTWIAALDYAIKLLKGLNNLESKDAFDQFYNETYGGGNK